MSFLKRFPVAFLAVAVIAVMSLATVDHAEARRGGSFGSRGARTYSAPSVTPTAPNAVAPIQRSMTPQNQTTPNYGAQPAPSRPGLFGGLFGGFGGSLLGGLALGGLVGMLFGHGFGGVAGGFGFIFQIIILAIGAMFLMRWFQSRNQRAPMGAVGGLSGTPAGFGGPAQRPQPMANSAFGGIAGFGARPAPSPRPANAINANDELGVAQADLDTFERLLYEVQGAFSREDYAALRERTTPEVMSYLAEELSENATKGLRNEVADVKLLRGDLSEAWSEGATEYATVAMHYQSRDWMRHREGTDIVSGDAVNPSETTEIWTFARTGNAAWKLSAIQET